MCARRISCPNRGCQALEHNTFVVTQIPFEANAALLSEMQTALLVIFLHGLDGATPEILDAFVFVLVAVSSQAFGRQIVI